jgi:hypothetical protein
MLKAKVDNATHMDLSKEIAERYKNMSNAELMEVLQHPAHYQAEAISIAKAEFNSRQLSEKDIHEATEALLNKDLKKELQNERIAVATNKMINAGNTFYDTINPIQATAPTAEKLIRFIALVFSGLFIYKIKVNFGLFSSIVKGSSHESFAYTTYIFPVVVELIAIVLFWLKKKSGWMLLAAFCSYSLVEVLPGLYFSIIYQSRENSFIHFATPSPISYIIAALFFAGTIAAMLRQDIKLVYKISKQNVQSMLVAGLLAGLLYFLLFLV